MALHLRVIVIQEEASSQQLPLPTASCLKPSTMYELYT